MSERFVSVEVLVHADFAAGTDSGMAAGGSDKRMEDMPCFVGSESVLSCRWGMPMR